MSIAKQGVKTVVPRLRFPEFRDAAAWKEENLEDLINTVSPPKKLQSASYRTTGRFPIIDQSQDAICGWTDDAQAVVGGPLPLIVFGDHTCVLKFVERPFAQGADGIKILVAKPAVTIQYLFHFLNHQPLVMEDYKRHFSTLKEQRVFFPSVESGEQKKIADCLTSLDEVIAAQGKKVEALKTHKRGLMQQLLPCEGETLPRLRFPEFRDAPKWVARPLGELMLIGSSRRVHESDWTTEGVPFYRAREVVAIGKSEPINPLFISEALYGEFTAFTGEIEEGQLLVTGVGSIGIPYLVKADDRFYFKDGNIIWLKNSQVDLVGEFLLRLFESEYVQCQIATMAGIGTVGTYTIENAKRTVVVFPVDKREQHVIADCLSSLDAKITAEFHHHAALKTHRRGLMQQLFPFGEGVL